MLAWLPPEALTWAFSLVSTLGGPGFLDRRPNARGRRGHLQMADTQWRMRIADGVDGGDQRPDGTRFADTLDAQRICRRGHGAGFEIHTRNILRAGHLIVHE